MKIKDFKCSGIGSSLFADNVKPFIQTAISLYRMRNSSEKIIERLTQINPIDDYYPGSRFFDDSNVATRICTGLVELATKFGNKNNTIEENIESFVYSLSASELDQIILEGMRNCASDDYWYTFEKKWD